MSIQIHDASRADVDTILDFIHQLADYEHLSDAVRATALDIEQQLFCAAPVAHCLIAERDGEAAGFALYFWNFSTFLARPGLYLEDLFVKPQQRAHGIGRRLLIELARRARARDCGRMEWAVLDWNEPAMRFYRSLGATNIDEWRIFRMTRAAIERLADKDAIYIPP
jgi:GNAT superfamily N-acetyltransferase